MFGRATQPDRDHKGLVYQTNVFEPSVVQAYSRSANSAESIQRHVLHGVISLNLTGFIMRTSNRICKPTSVYLQHTQLLRQCRRLTVDESASFAHYTSWDASLAEISGKSFLSQCSNQCVVKRCAVSRDSSECTIASFSCYRVQRAYEESEGIYSSRETRCIIPSYLIMMSVSPEHVDCEKTLRTSSSSHIGTPSTEAARTDGVLVGDDFPSREKLALESKSCTSSLVQFRWIDSIGGQM